MFIDPYNFQSIKISSKKVIAADTISILTEKPNGYSFSLGQYAIVKAPMSDGTSRTRQYSFASSPQSQKLEFLIRRQPGGEVSNWFYGSARSDSELQISRPLGSFLLDRDQTSLLIAGGIGIAPYLSIVKSGRHNSRLIYSERTSERVCYHQELDKKLRDKLQLNISSQNGRINRSTFDNYDLSIYQTFYICGSKLFVDDVYQLLTDLGIEPDSIKRELFTLQ